MVLKVLNYRTTQYLLSTLIILGMLICVFTPNYYLFKMGSSFAIQITLGYLLLGLVFLLCKQPRLMFTSFACCAGLCIFLKYSTNADITPLTQKTNEETITVAHFNLSASGEDFEQTIQKILSSDVDLISLQEVTPDWASLLNESMGEQYPYSNSLVRFDPFGISIYSKYPLVDMDTFFYEDIPNLAGAIRTNGNGEKVHFIASHTTPPLYSSAYIKMKEHLQAISQYATKISEKPIITIGDFYAPPWWKEIQDLKDAANLNDSRRSATLSFSQIFENPVDYIFHSHHLSCLDFQNVADENANHLGIMGEYQFTPTPGYAQKENR